MSNIPTTMRAIVADPPGGVEALQLIQAPVPVPGPGEVLIRVLNAGVNRPDILQRQGNYAPPSGSTNILGLEVAGEIAKLGTGESRWQVGDKVAALLPGGGYADYAIAPSGQCIAWPTGFDARQASVLPEALFTVWANVFETGQLRAGETLLLHGGASGIGSYAIQMAKAFGAEVIATAGNDEKTAFCKKLGAAHAINYCNVDFEVEVKRLTNNRGVDVVLDMVGGAYLSRNVNVLAAHGRLVIIATQQGRVGELDIGRVMLKRLTVMGSTLRSRSVEEKSRIAREVEARLVPLLAANAIKPVIFQSFPLEKVGEAHKLMESGAHLGKIALDVSV